MRQVVSTPERPLQLVVVGGGQLVRIHVGGRHAIVDAGPYRHHNLAAKRAAAEDVALRSPDEQGDADMAPVIGDEFERVGFQCAFAGRFHYDLRRASVGKYSQAVIVTRLKPDLVEQGIGLVGIMGDPGFREFRPVERALR